MIKLRVFPLSYWFMVVCPPPSFCLETTLMVTRQKRSGKEFAIKFHIIHSYYLWTFHRQVLILTVIQDKVHPISAQYRMHTIVFQRCLAIPAGSNSISGLKSSPICSSKSLIKSRSSSHLPVLVCLISCCHISFLFRYIIHQASSPLPCQVLLRMTADLHPTGPTIKDGLKP